MDRLAFTYVLLTWLPGGPPCEGADDGGMLLGILGILGMVVMGVEGCELGCDEFSISDICPWI